MAVVRARWPSAKAPPEFQQAFYTAGGGPWRRISGSRHNLSPAGNKLIEKLARGEREALRHVFADDGVGLLDHPQGSRMRFVGDEDLGAHCRHRGRSMLSAAVAHRLRRNQTISSKKNLTSLATMATSEFAALVPSPSTAVG